MPGRKRIKLSKAEAKELDSTSFIGEGGEIDNVLDEEIPVAAAAAEPAGAGTAAEPVASSTTMKWQNVLEKHQEKHPQIKWTEPWTEVDWRAHQANLALEKSEEGDKEMHRIGKANLKNVKQWYENSGVGGTKKNNKNKKNKNKKNKTKKGGKQTRRGGKKTRRRRNKTLKRKLSK